MKKHLTIAGILLISTNVLGISCDHVNQSQQLEQQQRSSQIELRKTYPTSIDDWVFDQCTSTVDSKIYNRNQLWKMIDEDNFNNEKLQKITNDGINIYLPDKTVDTIFVQILDGYILLKKSKASNAERKAYRQRIEKLFERFDMSPNDGVDKRSYILVLAIKAELPELVKKLLNRFEENYRKKIRGLISYNEDEYISKCMSRLVNKSNKYGETTLSEALYRKYFDLANLLIKYGADVNQKDKEGNPLVIRAYNQGKDIAKYLMEHGVDINAKEAMYGWTLFHNVAKNGDVKFARYLVEHGAKFDVQNYDRETPLHIAVQNEKEKFVKYLVEDLKASINACDSYKNTPLHIAVFCGNKTIVEYLVEHGADINTENEDGDTPLSIAQQEDYNDIANYLFEKGAIDEIIHFIW